MFGNANLPHNMDLQWVPNAVAACLNEATKKKKNNNNVEKQRRASVNLHLFRWPNNGKPCANLHIEFSLVNHYINMNASEIFNCAEILHFPLKSEKKISFRN